MSSLADRVREEKIQKLAERKEQLEKERKALEIKKDA